MIEKMGKDKNKLIFFVLLLQAFIFHIAYGSDSDSCKSLVRKTFSEEQKERILQKLSDVPHLQIYITKMIDDPHIPDHIKRILEKALDQEDSEIRHLTPQIREAIHMPYSVRAAVASQPIYYTHRYGELPVSQNLRDETTDQMTPYLTLSHKYTVFVEDRPLSAEINDLLSLVHELAHVRFQSFLESHIENLLKKLPSDLIYLTEKGEAVISSDLITFLDERYAFETQYELMSATVRRYYPYEPSVRIFEADVTLENYKSVISSYLLETFNIIHPDIRKLKDDSISEILLGHPFE